MKELYDAIDTLRAKMACLEARLDWITRAIGDAEAQLTAIRAEARWQKARAAIARAKLDGVATRLDRIERAAATWLVRDAAR